MRSGLSYRRCGAAGVLAQGPRAGYLAGGEELLARGEAPGQPARRPPVPWLRERAPRRPGGDPPAHMTVWGEAGKEVGEEGHWEGEYPLVVTQRAGGGAALG